jgi:hypothetical protein
MKPRSAILLAAALALSAFSGRPTYGQTSNNQPVGTAVSKKPIPKEGDIVRFHGEKELFVITSCREPAESEDGSPWFDCRVADTKSLKNEIVRQLLNVDPAINPDPRINMDFYTAEVTRFAQFYDKLSQASPSGTYHVDSDFNGMLTTGMRGEPEPLSGLGYAEGKRADEILTSVNKALANGGSMTGFVSVWFKQNAPKQSRVMVKDTFPLS